jgi:hypothetical protein
MGDSRVPHQAGKVAAVKMGVLVGHDIGEAGALGRFRPVLEAVVKRLEHVLRELRRTGIGVEKRKLFGH